MDFKKAYDRADRSSIQSFGNNGFRRDFVKILYNEA